MFGVDDVPPWGVALLSAVQQVALVSIYLIYPVLVAREAGSPPDVVRAVVSVTLLVHALGFGLQALPRGPVGSGYLCGPIPSAVYLTPSLAAASAGGLSLVFGMTLFAGLVETALSRGLRHLRPYFPPEIAGVVVLLIGLATGVVGVRALAADAAVRPGPAMATAVATLGTMVALTFWARGGPRLFCPLLGMVAGYATAAAVGGFAPDAGATLAAAPLVDVPHVGHLGWAFDAGLVLPFVVAAVAATLKTAGNVTTSQKMNDADWVRADMKSISRGVLADGLGSVAAGALGAPGVNSSTSCVGLAGATGVHSRAFIAALAIEIHPELVRQAPPALRTVLGSSLVVGTVVALALNGLSRVGRRQTRSLVVVPGQIDPVAVENFIDAHGATWGARADVVDRARFGLVQSLETIVDGCEPQGPILLEASFDEFNLDIRVSYAGPPLELPGRRPSNEEIMTSEEGQRRLAGFMLRRQADRVQAAHRAGRSTITFHFDH